LDGLKGRQWRDVRRATEASSAVDLLAAARDVLARLRVQRSGELFVFRFLSGGTARWRFSACCRINGWT
jgi:hypothetical protein